jgi:hypothetical protein
VLKRGGVGVGQELVVELGYGMELVVMVWVVLELV